MSDDHPTPIPLNDEKPSSEARSTISMILNGFMVGGLQIIFAVASILLSAIVCSFLQYKTAVIVGLWVMIVTWLILITFLATLVRLTHVKAIRQARWTGFGIGLAGGIMIILIAIFGYVFSGMDR